MGKKKFWKQSTATLKRVKFYWVFVASLNVTEADHIAETFVRGYFSITYNVFTFIRAKPALNTTYAIDLLFLGIALFFCTNTAWKVSKYGVFSGLYFPLFGLNSDIYTVNVRIQLEYKKIRTRKISEFGKFSRIVRKCLRAKRKKKMANNSGFVFCASMLFPILVSVYHDVRLMM